MSNEKVVMITGAGIGIGAADALAFAKKGYRVVVTDILEKEGLSIARKITDGGGTAEFFPLDVTDTSQTNQVIEQIISKFGRMDCLVANAGIAHRVKFTAMTDAQWDLTMEIDLKGAMRACRAAAPWMSEKKAGSMVLVSSIMGIAYGWDEHAHYTAAKAGIIGLVRALAVELAKSGIRVNGVAPGFIRSAQSLSPEHSMGPSGLENAAKYIPLGRVGEPDDIADVVVFLASNEARYVTGQIITVDGGLVPGRY